MSTVCTHSWLICIPSQEPKFQAAGLTTLVINAVTTDAARVKDGRDLWTHASQVDVLLLAPEQLSTSGFDRLLKDKTYQKRVVALGVDEVHLLNSWGQSFRKAFNQIGGARMRFDYSPILIALTATLRTGPPLQSVCMFLGLHLGHYHLIRRSNLRHDIRLLFRTVQSSARSMTFPELDWVLLEQRRVIVFCRTIALGFRVAVYLRARAELDSVAGLDERICMYNSLNWESYNEFTLDLMHSNSSQSWVTVATDTLSVGIDVSNTDDVVLYGFELPPDTDSVLQKGGRIRDGKGKGSRLVVYLPKKATALCREVIAQVAEGAPPTTVKTGKGKHSVLVDVGVAELVVASCKSDTIDRLYGNPRSDIPCRCHTCLQHPPLPRPTQCDCCGCSPESTVTLTRELPRARPSRPPGPHITLKMRAYAEGPLVKFRKAARASMEDWSLLPAEEILPAEIIKLLLDNFNTIVDIPTLQQATSNYEHLRDRYPALLSVVKKLGEEFEEMRTQTKAARLAKARETRARNKAAKEANTMAASDTPSRAEVDIGGEEDGDGEESDDYDSDEDDELHGIDNDRGLDLETSSELDDNFVIPNPVRFTIRIPGGKFHQ